MGRRAPSYAAERWSESSRRSAAGAETWLIAAAAAGAQRTRHKTAEAVDLAKLYWPQRQVNVSEASAVRLAGSRTTNDEHADP